MLACYRTSISMPTYLLDSRSKGSRGANVDALRGTTGATFEGAAKVGRNSYGMRLFGADRGSNQEVYVVVKGSFCFVFSTSTCSSPRFAICLQNLRPTAVTTKKVRLEEMFGLNSYEFTFGSEETSLAFSAAAERQAKKAEVEAVCKHLGHEHLLNKRKSVVFAEAVAVEKEKHQPAEPIGATEVFRVMAAGMGV